MTKRVLVPLDGSRNAEAALASLEQICDTDHELVLLMVKKPHQPERIGYLPGVLAIESVGRSTVTPDLPVFAETTDQSDQQQLAEAGDYLDTVAACLRQKGYKVETEVLIDEKPEQTIVEYAKRTGPTFIAMVRRTHHGLGEILFGSVASGIVRSEVAPVLLIPAIHAHQAPNEDHG